MPFTDHASLNWLMFVKGKVGTEVNTSSRIPLQYRAPEKKQNVVADTLLCGRSSIGCDRVVGFRNHRVLWRKIPEVSKGCGEGLEKLTGLKDRMSLHIRTQQLLMAEGESLWKSCDGSTTGQLCSGVCAWVRRHQISRSKSVLEKETRRNSHSRNYASTSFGNIQGRKKFLPRFLTSWIT